MRTPPGKTGSHERTPVSLPPKVRVHGNPLQIGNRATRSNDGEASKAPIIGQGGEQLAARSGRAGFFKTEGSELPQFVKGERIEFYGLRPELLNSAHYDMVRSGHSLGKVSGEQFESEVVAKSIVPPYGSGSLWQWRRRDTGHTKVEKVINAGSYELGASTDGAKLRVGNMVVPRTRYSFRPALSKGEFPWPCASGGELHEETFLKELMSMIPPCA